MTTNAIAKRMAKILRIHGRYKVQSYKGYTLLEGNTSISISTPRMPANLQLPLSL